MMAAWLVMACLPWTRPGPPARNGGGVPERGCGAQAACTARKAARRSPRVRARPPVAAPWWSGCGPRAAWDVGAASMRRLARRRGGVRRAARLPYISHICCTPAGGSGLRRRQRRSSGLWWRRQLGPASGPGSGTGRAQAAVGLGGAAQNIRLAAPGSGSGGVRAAGGPGPVRRHLVSR